MVVRVLPVQDDEGGASLHRYHGEVRGWGLGRCCGVGLARLVFREVVERGGDGAGLFRFLVCLVDDVRSCG